MFGTCTSSEWPTAIGCCTALHEAGVGAGIHYPYPIHLTGAYAHLGMSVGRSRLRKLRRTRCSPSHCFRTSPRRFKNMSPRNLHQHSTKTYPA